MTVQELFQKKWIFPPLDINLQTKISNALRISPLLSQLLINRGLTDIQSAEIFLQSKLSLLSDPMLLPDIKKSSERIIDALSKGEKITVYGDYDVDGISATALMVQCLETLSGLYWNHESTIDYYIPDRLEEGYGLSVEAIEKLSEMGTKVIITVDCGVNSFDEAKVARRKGIDLIITDHHEPGDKSPDSGKNADAVNPVSCGCDDAFGLINPKLITSNYPFRELAGVGVAFMLAWALGQMASTRTDHSTVRPDDMNGHKKERQSETPNKKVAIEFRDFLMDAIGLTALGTIADVVPLKQENRILAKYGLSSLENSSNPGIKALKEIAGLKDKTIHSNHVGFNLGPRINAAGRVGNAKKGVELLTAKCENEAKELAEYLESENKRRQKIQSEILISARKMILNDVDVNSEMAIIISDDGWHQGVVGVVASRLASEFYRPVIIIAIDGEMGHGSARSVPDFNLYNALVKCQEYFSDRKLLISFGGHAQAAGLRILKKDISVFREIFNAVSAEQMQGEWLSPTLNIDMEVRLSSISNSLFKEMQCLFPHGEGNQVPVFATRNVKAVGQIRRFGVNGKHLGFYVRQGDVSFKTVGFGLGDKIDVLKQNNGNCSIAYVLRHPYRKETNRLYNNNNMMNGENIELELKDISP
ncbi:single-stranded DNA-specific exonuclease [Candidatus Scalindua japonica]|uniref:Single-stranded-DNA-specific exonuclease RecJ n=1 Tax=Candidatus Scalindua japonica TaxID=1284222 RepID=A0A286U3S6_9BACT|nr:single-stranded-DNA-specific exonuclease RecJ [Candidatus Scalindua japonica]GAX62808.1 single-stranded DNA-specific exonuclease [Candidatus Scalindua japonica]